MNKFIVIGGLDGSGKDTQVNLLADMYEKQGCNVVVRSHPCPDNKYGRKSKEALLKTGKINHLLATIYYDDIKIKEEDVLNSFMITSVKEEELPLIYCIIK